MCPDGTTCWLRPTHHPYLEDPLGELPTPQTSQPLWTQSVCNATATDLRSTPRNRKVHQIDPACVHGGTLVINTPIYLQAPGKTHLMMKMQCIYQKTARIYTRYVPPWNSKLTCTRLPYTRQSDFGTAYLKLEVDAGTQHLKDNLHMVRYSATHGNSAGIVV